jgi:hypothetical protein
MTDLQKMMSMYDSFGIPYEVEKRSDCESDEMFYGHIGRYVDGKYPEYDSTLTIGKTYTFITFEFKDEKFYNHYLMS